MTKKINPNSDFIKKNFDKVIDLINNTVKSHRKQKLLDMLDFFDDRYASSPATDRKDYHCAFPGGLVYHNLNVLQWTGRFANLMAKDQFDNETLLVVSLFHNLGKLGDKEKDYYLPQKSDWHRQRGMLYEINPEIDYFKVAHRTLWLLSRFGIELSQDEFLAILLHEGLEDETNKHYAHKFGKLTQILQFAISTAIQNEKELEY